MAAGNSDHVVHLKCSVSARFQSKLSTMKNFTTTFIKYLANVCISAIKEHAQSDIHKHTMILKKKSMSSVSTEYSSVVFTFAQSSFVLPSETR